MSGGATPRVLFSFPGRLGRTGIGTTAWHQAQGLVEEGLDVYVFCGSCERPVVGAAKVVETLRPAGILIPYRIMGDQRAWRWHDKITARALRKGLDVQVVHCWPMGAKYTLNAARERGIASFLERPNTHTRFAFEVVAKELERLKLTLPRNHSHRADPDRLAHEEGEYALADFLLCPADFVARTFLERGFGPDRIAHTQYGYDPTRFITPVKNGRHNRKLVVGFFGSCEPRKGVHYALDAWKRASLGDKAELRFYGKFVPGYREHLAALLSEPNVKEMGFTEDVPAAMRDCDVMVLPSIEEGSALVTYEARASGCVLVVSDAAGARCTHLLDGLVHPVGDVDALAGHLKLLADDPDLLVRLRQQSLDGVHDLTWKAAAKRLVSAYNAALATRAQDDCGAGITKLTGAPGA